MIPTADILLGIVVGSLGTIAVQQLAEAWYRFKNPRPQRRATDQPAFQPSKLQHHIDGFYETVMAKLDKMEGK